jgi:hypothetical protein
MIKILHNLALFWVKNAIFFAEFFGENILKITTSVPGHTGVDARPTFDAKSADGDVRSSQGDQFWRIFNYRMIFFIFLGVFF